MAPQSNDKKFILSTGLVVVTIVYALWQTLSGSPSAIVATAPVPQSVSVPQTQTPAPTSANVPPPPKTQQTTSQSPSSPMTGGAMRARMMAGQYADGSYVGTQADAYYGIVQVKAIVSGGRLSDVQFLQYPSDRSTSRYINSQAMPMLTQEAISAQSANVNGVSGATATSGAFIQSLASALVQAKI